MAKGAFSKEGDKFRCVECGQVHDTHKVGKTVQQMHILYEGVLRDYCVEKILLRDF